MIEPVDETRRRRWQDALAAAGTDRPSTDDCPPCERIWEAARGLLDTDSVRRLLDHTSRCPGCSLAWRLALEVDVASTGEAAVIPITRRAPPRWIWGLAAGLLGVALLASFLLDRLAGPGNGNQLRNAAEISIGSLVDGKILDRESCWLRWTPVPDRLSYSVLVANEDLEVLARGDRLEEAELRVPHESLEDLPAGAKLVWRVEARLADGSTLRSPSFVNAVQ